MPGVSKHYMYCDTERRFFDKRAAEHLKIIVRQYLSAGQCLRLDRLSPSLSWRKKLLSVWNLAKESRIPEYNGWTLTEFRVRKGGGWKDRKTIFKQYANNYRKFKVVSNKKKVFVSAGHSEQPVQVISNVGSFPPQPFVSFYRPDVGSPEDYPAPPPPPPEGVYRDMNLVPRNANTPQTVPSGNPFRAPSWNPNPAWFGEDIP